MSPTTLLCILVPQQLEKTTVIFAQNQRKPEAVDHMKSRQNSYSSVFLGSTWENSSGRSVWCFANNPLPWEGCGAGQQRRKSYWFDLLCYLCILKNWTIVLKMGHQWNFLLMYCLDSVLHTDNKFIIGKMVSIFSLLLAFSILIFIKIVSGSCELWYIFTALRSKGMGT